MNGEIILGIDLGGTNIRGGIVKDNSLQKIVSQKINSKASFDEVLKEAFIFIDQLFNSSVKAIGIGVPGLVSNGVVFDVVNIPSWEKIFLQQLMQQRYSVPVFINNDANCFALGEFYFGKGKNSDSMIGLSIGTGLGSGIIINKKLYEGKNCGAGEFGMIDYLDHSYEYYASGQFFQNVYGISGDVVFHNASQQNGDAIKMLEAFGMHLGNAIKTILYALDVELIVLGGSVSNAFSLFSKTMQQQVETFAYKKTIENLKIEVSELPHCGVLGAAALCYDTDSF